MRAIETKDYGHGITGKVYLDEGGTDGPHEWGNDTVLLAVLHRRYLNPAPQCGDTPEALEQWAKENAREYAAFPLFLYAHGNTIYRATDGGNPFHCPWDSGRVGYAFVKKSDFKRRRAHWLKAAQSFCQEYTAWANGEIYGYVLEDDDENQLDSCWGFIGDIAYCIEEMDSAAKHHVQDAIAREATETEESRPDLYC